MQQKAHPATQEAVKEWLNIFLQPRPPAAAPPSTTDVVPPPPSAGVGKFMEEKGTAPLHSLPTPACQVARELDSQGVDRWLRIQWHASHRGGRGPRSGEGRLPKAHSRKAAYKIHCLKGNPQPSAAKPPSILRSLPPAGRVKLKNLSSQPLFWRKKDSTKTRIQIPARQYCGPLRIRRQRWAYRKVLQPPWTCRPGMRAHAARDGIRVFVWWSCFLESAESVPISLGPGKSGREIRNLYTGTRGFPICQSCIPAGIFAIYMTDRSRILPWSFRISFSIHLYCISPLFLQPAFEILSIFKKSVCSVHSSIDRRKYENIIKFFISTFTKTRFFLLIE